MEMDMFADAMVIDNRTGRVTGADARLEGDSFVFSPSAGPGRQITMPKTPDVRREAFLGFARIRADAAARCGREGGDPTPGALVDGLLAFAAAHGPLFGFAGLGAERPEIREPVADWLAAQAVMEAALKAEVFSRGGDVDPAAVDDCFRVEVSSGGGSYRWEYVFDPGVVPGGLYLTCLKRGSSESYTTEDGSILRSSWIGGGGDSPEGRMVARFSTEYPEAVFGEVERRAPYAMRLSAVRGRPEIEAEVASLLKIVAGKHTGGVSLDFRNPMSAVGAKEEGAYGIVCTSYLSYMWHELAQAYTRNSFRVCANPKCENIISINEETSSGKRFCSERCRVQANNAKLSAQNTRAREAFYACKPYAEIYEEAFGKELSFKDPERAKLCQRLDRWIERQFSKSAAGRSALKRGAARR
jgi:hypothetical protein